MVKVSDIEDETLKYMDVIDKDGNYKEVEKKRFHTKEDLFYGNDRTA